jgi:hypothetical protein
MWAVVSATGALARGSGVVSSTRLGLGEYRVTAGVDISQCSYTATVGDTGNIDDTNLAGGYARVGRTPGNPQSVTVLIFRNQTVVDDYPFHLQVSC